MCHSSFNAKLFSHIKILSLLLCAMDKNTNRWMDFFSWTYWYNVHPQNSLEINNSCNKPHRSKHKFWEVGGFPIQLNCVSRRFPDILQENIYDSSDIWFKFLLLLASSWLLFICLKRHSVLLLYILEAVVLFYFSIKLVSCFRLVELSRVKHFYLF